jgi:hypothetical protein
MVMSTSVDQLAAASSGKESFAIEAFSRALRQVFLNFFCQ